MSPLTERQLQVYQAIVSSIRERGVPPTIREIGAAVFIRSTNGVVEHLRALEKKGWIVMPPNAGRSNAKSRGIRLVNDFRIDVSDLSPEQREQVRSLVNQLRRAA